MRLKPHHSDSFPSPDQRVRRQKARFISTSLITPGLAILGFILSGIPYWIRIVGCMGLMIFIFKQNHPSKQNIQTIILETQDGDVLRCQGERHLELYKMRHWGWAGSWGLKLVIAGPSHKKIVLSSSYYPPASLRHLIRQRIFAHSSPQEQNACVQTPDRPRVWL